MFWKDVFYCFFIIILNVVSMETCAYNKVNSAEANIVHSARHRTNKESRKPFLRQLLVCSGLWTTYFATGLSLGAPTVVIPQLRRAANSSLAVSDEMASWLSCTLSYSAMPWVVILPLAARFFGRKPPLLFASALSVASFILLYLGQTVWTFLLSQIIQGILFGSNLTVSIILIGEYTSPQYRGVFLSVKSASVFWGMWVSNAIGTFFHWSQIGAFGLICCVYYLTFFLWPESPTYLATRGRFEECAKAHRWLKGTDENAELELEKLIESQRNRHSQEDGHYLASFISMLTLKEFYKPILLSSLIMGQYHALGKIVWSMYSIEVIKKITDNESTAYTGMLILDGVTVFSMYVGSIISKFIKRRTLLFSSSIVSIVFLFVNSLYLWLVYLNIINENKIVSIGLLAAFSIAISCGPMILSLSIYAELLPLRFKYTGIIIVILIHFTLMGTGIKMAPWVFRTLKLYGTFSFYGTLASIFTYILFKYLPETKDKTLQQIEEYFTDKNTAETEMNIITKKLILSKNGL